MHYYQHNIKDFNNATRHLTRVERALYRDAIELYYDGEQPLTADLSVLSRRLLVVGNDEKEALNYVLGEFFYLDGEAYRNKRCDSEIEKYHNNNSAKARAGKASAAARRKKKEAGQTPAPTESNTRSTPAVQSGNGIQLNQEPRTNNQEPIKDKKIMSSQLDDALDVIEYLNLTSKSNFQPVASNTKFLLARFAEGRTVDEIKAVIDRQNILWPEGDPQRKYLRPATLFNAEKFNQYFGQLGRPINSEQSNGRHRQHGQPVGEVAQIHATIDARAKERANSLQGRRGGLHEGGAAVETV